MFYEKFNYRYHATAIFKWAWTNSQFKKRTLEEIGTPYWEKFSNCLFNDSNQCLEEGLGYMEKIREVEDKLNMGQ